MLPVVFFSLSIISGLFTIYLIILGMAPQTKPLNWTGFFIYGPGPGFFILLLWLATAIILQIICILANDSVSYTCNYLSWIALISLMLLELVIFLDFKF